MLTRLCPSPRRPLLPELSPPQSASARLGPRAQERALLGLPNPWLRPACALRPRPAATRPTKTAGCPASCAKVNPLLFLSQCARVDTSATICSPDPPRHPAVFDTARRLHSFDCVSPLSQGPGDGVADCLWLSVRACTSTSASGLAGSTSSPPKPAEASGTSSMPA